MPKLKTHRKLRKQRARKTKNEFSFVTSKVLDKLIAAEIGESFEETAFTLCESLGFLKC